jgi:hypothetical protein
MIMGDANYPLIMQAPAHLSKHKNPVQREKSVLHLTSTAPTEYREHLTALGALTLVLAIPTGLNRSAQGCEEVARNELPG